MLTYGWINLMLFSRMEIFLYTAGVSSTLFQLWLVI